MFRKLLFLTIFLLSSGLSLAQVWPEVQRFRNDEKGSQIYRREGTMDGNLVRTLFYNNSEVAQWPYSPSGEWPKGTGINYVDGICMIVSIAVDSVQSPTNRKRYNRITPIETYYREEMDIPVGVPANLATEPWGWAPVPNYSNPGASVPAMSAREKSWPAKWPAALGLPSSYDGQWNGYFGRNIFNADLETFFVMDDSKDAEWTKLPISFYPILSDTPAVFTDSKQWFNPDIRKGLGLRVESRAFQWSHVLAEDIIFWHYDISNLSDRDYDSTFFGFYTDTGLGGEPDNGDDWASFDAKLDLTWGFDKDGKVPGRPKVTLGVYGYAYLESPGQSQDGVDNDEDGMIDERRDDGFDNDRDWKRFVDDNLNGIWDWDSTNQTGEILLDDVGADGAGPFDEPWDSVTQAFKLHIPDLGEGDGLPTDGEPNFDRLDKDESDQIGLTSVAIEKLDGKSTKDMWPKNDDVLYNLMARAKFDTSVQNSNIQIIFSSGPFLLRSGINPNGFGRERFSMALLFGDDKTDLVFNKKTVQFIYNAGYNFTKPPLKPKVTAKAGDKKVYLYWDSRAEQSTDPVLGFENNDPKQGPKKDFEGYAIYRSTEPEFNDVKLITDSQGQAKYYKPIAQWDKIDGIFGPDPVGINGAAYWRGDETGLSHAYVDSDVLNGVTYYYAVVSYDQGFINDSSEVRIQPTECTKLIQTNQVGQVYFVDYNCAVVTPNAPPAGYTPPSFAYKAVPDQGTGSIGVEVVNSDAVLDNATYSVVFDTTGTFPDYVTSGARVIRNGTDTLGVKITGDQIGDGSTQIATSAFDGLVMQIVNDPSTAILGNQSKWTAGDVNQLPNIRLREPIGPARGQTGYNAIYWYTDPDNPAAVGTKPRYKHFGADYEIVYYDSLVTSSLRNDRDNKFKKMKVNFKIFNLTQDRKEVPFILWMADTTKTTLTPGADRIIPVHYYPDGAKNQLIERWPVVIEYGLPSDVGKPDPAPGSTFRVRISKKFVRGDEFVFTSTAQSLSKKDAKSNLSKIRVVPNPYIGGAKWEPRLIQQSGRGNRKIDFINLPNNCTLRIYTIAGSLVKTLSKTGEIDPDSGTEVNMKGAVSWDLVSEDGMDVAYGVYIYHVDAPGIGEHIGKFALIK
ncbi:MAG: hypothetical protein LCH54_06140 [Bacteroidetes bacterium]|nr:hypothetical protein [Bacteroidota bacterium]